MASRYLPKWYFFNLSGLDFALECSSYTGGIVTQTEAKYCFNLYHKANNSYTQYNWAQWLSNHAVVDELNRLKDDASFFVHESTVELKKVKIFISIAAAAANNIRSCHSCYTIYK
jgi:hypothetical protein